MLSISNFTNRMIRTNIKNNSIIFKGIKVKIMKHKLFILLITFLIVGCSTGSFKKTKYRYLANSDDPQLEFTSDFVKAYYQPVYFSLNIVTPEQNRCSDFNTVGYYYPIKTFFHYPRMVTNLNAGVPANKLVSIESHYDMGNLYCYAPIKQFTAEKGKNYQINFKVENGYCELHVIDKQTSQPVKAQVKKACTK